MNVLIAGEASIHLRNYCKAIRPHIAVMSVIAETVADIPEADRRDVVSVRSVNPMAWLSAYHRIRKIIIDVRPDLIHLHQVNRLALLVSTAAESLGIPVVTTAWGSDVLLVPQRNFVFRYMTKRVLRISRRITADAPFPMPFMMSAERASRIIRRGLERDKARIAFPFGTKAAVWLGTVLPGPALQLMSKTASEVARN